MIFVLKYFVKRENAVKQGDQNMVCGLPDSAPVKESSQDAEKVAQVDAQPVALGTMGPTLP